MTNTVAIGSQLGRFSTNEHLSFQHHQGLQENPPVPAHTFTPDPAWATGQAAAPTGRQRGEPVGSGPPEGRGLLPGTPEDPEAFDATWKISQKDLF